MKRIIPIILVIILPLYILLFSVELNTFNLDMFEKHFKENNIEAETGRTKDELLEIADDLLGYLRGKNIDLSQHFNDREVKHMVDVEVLFHYGLIIKKLVFVLSILSIIYIIYRRDFILESLNILYKGLFFWWVGIGGFLILSLFDFTKYFTYFHLLFFDNDLWLLDPETDLMIQMLPEIFFISIFVKIVIGFLIGLLLLHGLVYVLRKREDKKAMEDKLC